MTQEKKNRLKAMALATVMMTSLSGCISRELSDNYSNYDVIDTNLNDDNELQKGIKQVLDVNGEDFKLVIEYRVPNTEWRITDNKNLFMTIYTQGLVGKKVYIDNIHMDTSIVSTKPNFNGIKQDTLDDRIHNSLMLGFPISDTNTYYGKNEIEGQNSEFIEGYSYGYAGYSGGSVYQKRRLESDYLEAGVYANKIDGVIGLIVEDQETGELRGVDVDTALIVRVNNTITFEEKDGYVTYQYDENGNRVETSRTKKNDNNKVKVLKRINNE